MTDAKQKSLWQERQEALLAYRIMCEVAVHRGDERVLINPGIAYEMFCIAIAHNELQAALIGIYDEGERKVVERINHLLHCDHGPRKLLENMNSRCKPHLRIVKDGENER